MTNLKHTRELTSNLKHKLQPAMFKAGSKLLSNITKNWRHNKGADGTRFSALTPSYRKKKIKRTGRGSADMHLSGHMTQSLDVFPIGKYRVKVAFSGKNEQDKAEGNASHRPNMMVVTKKHAHYISNLVLKEIFP